MLLCHIVMPNTAVSIDSTALITRCPSTFSTVAPNKRINSNAIGAELCRKSNVMQQILPMERPHSNTHRNRCEKSWSCIQFFARKMLPFNLMLYWRRAVARIASIPLNGIRKLFENQSAFFCCGSWSVFDNQWRSALLISNRLNIHSTKQICKSNILCFRPRLPLGIHWLIKAALF